MKPLFTIAFVLVVGLFCGGSSAQAQYSVSVTPSSVVTGTTLTASWTAPGGHSSTDFMAIYMTGASDVNYLAWGYVTTATSGTMTFVAPAQGTCEVRYFLNNDFTLGATSNTVTVSSPPAWPTSTTPPATGAQFYVSPTGNAGNNGSIGQPWDLATALLQPAAVQPGATIWLRGGTYNGTFTSWLVGSVGAPIMVRQYPGERATIDSGSAVDRTLDALLVNGSDTWYWDFEVMDSNTSRNNTGGFNNPVLRATSVNVFGPRTKFINLIVHDGLMGFGVWVTALDSELYGNIIYNVGVAAPDRGHGHSIYTQNQTGWKRLVNNILSYSFGYGVHAYTEGGYINNIYMEGNTSFNQGRPSGEAGFLVGAGSKVGINPAFLNNYAYFSPGAGGRGVYLDYGAGCHNPTITNNYLVANIALGLNCSNVSAITGNSFIGGLSGFTSGTYPSNTYSSSRPTTGNQVFVRPNFYQTGRANITIYNWALAANVSVNLSTTGLTNGQTYEIRNVQNYFGTLVATGTYNSGSPTISVPMNSAASTAVTQPIGWGGTANTTTAPEFQTFVLLPTSGGAGNPAPTVSSISPTSGTAAGGTSVTITGTGFLGGATVSIGGSAATSVNVASGTSITATSPSHAAGAVSVVVTNTDAQAGTLTNGYTYTNPAPTVSSISPTSGTTAGATSVTITGTGFLGGATVSIGGSAATSVNVASSTSITANTPAHAAGLVNVVVTNTDAQTGTLTNGYTYVAPAPTVTAISPTSGTTAGGTAVTITGTGFVSGATIAIGGSAATSVNFVNSTSITAVTPAHAAGLVNVVVTNPSAQTGTLTNGYTYTNPAPTVSGIAPSTGTTAGGTAVTITGTGFLAGATVTIGGSTATSVVLVGPTSITAVTPAHATGATNVVVTNTDAQAATLINGFTFMLRVPSSGKAVMNGNVRLQ